MTDSRLYALQLEKKLIEEFKLKFEEKLGYTPVVLTKFENGELTVPLMSLGQLVDYFQPYLPTEYGKKLSLFSKSRKREIVELRMMFCFLARSMKYKLSTIGSFLGGRDHTTVMHNVATFINLMETNDQFRSLFQEILNHIKENHESPTLGILDTPQRKSKPALLP